MYTRSKQLKYSLLFMLPAIFFVGVFYVVPLSQSFYLSLFSWDILDPDPTSRFVGLQNFVRFLEMDAARGALRNTVIYAIGASVLKNISGLLVAIALNAGLRTQGPLRTLILSTTMVPLIIAGYIWSYLYHPEFGLGPFLSNYLGLGFLHQQWLSNASLVLFAVIIVSSWQILGKYMVIYLAGLQTVPQELYEVADLDGVGPIRKFFKITLPLIAPAVTIGVMNAAIMSLRVFDEIWAMTRGGPGFASETMTTLLYCQTFFYSGRAGFGSAISVILFNLVLVFSLILLFVLRRREQVAYGK